MNWSTIAPETRLYKGKNLFRWEVSPGLEHHCGICATPLHNGRAKTTCIGKHVEPCYRFHQQLHFVGKSHECFGCNTSDEMHYNRHKEILKIIRQITELDGTSAITPIKLDTSKMARRDSITTTSESTPTDTGSETFQGDRKTTRRERKMVKKSGNNPSKDRRNMEIFPREDIDFVSEAIHLSIMESKGAWEGTYVYSNTQAAVDDDEKKYPESGEADVEGEDIPYLMEHVNLLSVKASSEMTPRQRKVEKKFYSPIDHSSFGSGSRRYNSDGAKKSDIYNGVNPDIFFRLNVELVRPSNSKARKDLVSRLVAAIKEDLEVIEREALESKMREEGFWRWAGKTSYDIMSRTREDIDWATGQKKGISRSSEESSDDDINVIGVTKGATKNTADDTLLGPIIEPEPIEPNLFRIVPAKAARTVKAQAPALKPLFNKTKAADVLRADISSKKKIKAIVESSSESEDDMNDDGNGEEMLLRYKQRLEGHRNIGRPSASGGKTNRVMRVK